MTTSYYSETAFVDAWARGVKLAGPQFFANGTGIAPGNSISKFDLAPDFDMIESAMGYLSSGEAVFLAAMYSFYNADTGGRWLSDLGAGGLGDVSARIDEPRRRVLADLLVAYAGW